MFYYPLMDKKWRDSAACLHAVDEDLDFFSEEYTEQAKAYSLCNSCPVQRACLEDALESKSIYGIWGGKSQWEIRRALSVDEMGDLHDWGREIWCVNCQSKDISVTHKRRVRVKVTCHECGLIWHRLRVVRPRLKRKVESTSDVLTNLE